jgi:hypothetical protein
MEGNMHDLPILSTIITFAFAAAVFSRYSVRRGTHLLLWGIGLVLYGIGTLAEVVSIFTFNAVALRLWYLSGAMLTAAWLGQGTINLLVRRKGVAPALNIILTVVSLIAVGLVFLAPITSAAATFNTSQPLSAQYKDILTRSGVVIMLTILLNTYGTLTLVGGAIYSAYIFWRKRILFNRMIGNILIAAGAILPAMGGSFINMGLPDFLYLSELLGAVLMYLGFLQATVMVTVKVPSPAAAANNKLSGD